MTDNPLPGEQGGVLTAPETRTRRSSKVVLFNDEDHTYDYVVEMLVHVCKMARAQAFRCAVEVDMEGRTIVYYGTHDECLRISAQITSYGPDHRLMRSRSGMNSEVQSF